MSITKNDEKQLREWFLNLSNCTEKGIDLRKTLVDYYFYRENITKLVLKKLDDLFTIKKFEWARRNKIREDDATSIIHDALLTSLDKFKLTANVKFITFFWKVLHSKLFNFICKYNIVKKHQRYHIPFFMTHSLDHLKLNSEKTKHLDPSKLSKLTLDYLMADNKIAEAQIECNFMVEYMLARLSKEHKYILNLLLQGETKEKIAEDLNVTGETVRLKLNKIRKKFKDIEDQLCQIRKQ